MHVHVLQLYTHSIDGHLFECVVWQRKKASESVFVPTSLKNLMVTGVFGEKVRLREVEGMGNCVHTCNYCLVLAFLHENSGLA